MSRKPILSLERNNAGRVFIGLTEFGENDMAVRACVLSDSGEHTHESVMRRRFGDMVRLMDVEPDDQLEECHDLY